MVHLLLRLTIIGQSVDPLKTGVFFRKQLPYRPPGPKAPLGHMVQSKKNNELFFLKVSNLRVTTSVTVLSR